MMSEKLFPTPNLAMANYYHRGHIEHCQEQIEKARRFFKRLVLRTKWKINSSSYIDAMERHIVYSNIEEENEQRVSAIDWKIVDTIKRNKKFTKKQEIEIEKLNKEREIHAEKRDEAREETNKIADYLRKFGLSPSRII